MLEPRPRLGLFLAACLLAGVIAGVVWALGAELPVYVLDDNLAATMSETQLATVFGADALFTLLVGVLGLGLGILSWFWFNASGWWVCVLAIIGALLMALVTWQTGVTILPPDFQERLATANPGDVVPVDLQLRSHAALVMAPFAAITPVMLLAAFWPESPPAAQGDHVDEDAHAST